MGDKSFEKKERKTHQRSSSSVEQRHNDHLAVSSLNDRDTIEEKEINLLDLSIDERFIVSLRFVSIKLEEKMR